MNEKLNDNKSTKGSKSAWEQLTASYCIKASDTIPSVPYAVLKPHSERN